MRHNQGQNQKRSRGRGRRSSNHGQTNFNRNTTFDSNGPDGRLRGNALQLFEKYTALAHDANSAGERISAEALAQFADHYYRIHQTVLQTAEQNRRNQEERQQQNRKPESAASEASEKSAESIPAAELGDNSEASPRPNKRGRTQVRTESQDEDEVDSGAQTTEEADEAVA